MTDANQLILVTGGSGFLGHNLCEFLLRKGFRVRVLDLLPFDYPHIEGVDAIIGDVRNKDDMLKACRGVSGIVHCAVALPRESKEDIFSTTVAGTRVCLDIADALDIERFIFMSSTAVYGVPKSSPITEDSPLDGLGPYGEAKVIAEKMVLSRNGCAVVIRPKSFLGKGRLGIFDVIFDWIASGKNIPLIGRGDNLYQLLEVQDLCEAIGLCLTLPQAQVQGVFNVGAEVFGTMRGDVQFLLDKAGFGKKVIPLPVKPVIAALRVLETVKLSPIYSWVYATASKDSHVSVEKIKKQLGWSAKFSNRDALLTSYQDYLVAIKSKQLCFGGGHRARWRQGALSLVKMFF